MRRFGVAGDEVGDRIGDGQRDDGCDRGVEHHPQQGPAEENEPRPTRSCQTAVRLALDQCSGFQVGTAISKNELTPPLRRPASRSRRRHHEQHREPIAPGAAAQYRRQRLRGRTCPASGPPLPTYPTDPSRARLPGALPDRVGGGWQLGLEESLGVAAEARTVELQLRGKQLLGDRDTRRDLRQRLHVSDVAVVLQGRCSRRAGSGSGGARAPGLSRR